MKDISELLILEQFLRTMDSEIELWISERDSKSAEDAARQAEVFLSARSGSKTLAFSRDTRFTRCSKSYGGDEGAQNQSRIQGNFRKSFSKPSTTGLNKNK